MSKDLKIKVITMPRDANVWGTIFGGVLLNHIDEAAGLEALRHTKRRMVTVAIKEAVFLAPVLVGDLLSFYAETTKIGRSSVTVTVTVEGERLDADPFRAATAEVVFVAVDENNRSCPLNEEGAELAPTSVQ